MLNPQQDIPRVAIIGRVNVGKSTLFNRLVEKHKSLVSDIPGTTRDRFEANCIWRAQVVRLIDTGGLDGPMENEVDQAIAQQARMALDDADMILFVVDATTGGPQVGDLELAKELMALNKPVIVAANKADNRRLRLAVDQDWEGAWPLSTPIAVSAKHGNGTGDMLDVIYEQLEELNRPPVDIVDVSTIRVSVIGQPNVGKSSLLNSILGQHRYIASSKEHTTREPNDTLVNVDGQNYLLIDTAGVRKMARIHAGKSKLEKSGVSRTLTTMRKSDVVLFVLDVSRKVSTQDKHLAGAIEDAGASAIIVANKWDKIPDKDSNTINDYEKYIRAHLPSLSYAPIIFTSAITGKRVQHIFDVLDVVYRNRFTELDRKECDKFIAQAIGRHKPSRGKGAAHPNVTGFKQTGINPPTFTVAIKQKHKESLNPAYLRFLKNLLRKAYGFEGTPIRMVVTAGKRWLR